MAGAGGKRTGRQEDPMIDYRMAFTRGGQITQQRGGCNKQAQRGAGEFCAGQAENTWTQWVPSERPAESVSWQTV
jgi:hypothetical protein